MPALNSIPEHSHQTCHKLYLAVSVAQLRDLKRMQMRILGKLSSKQCYIFLKQNIEFAQLIAECWFAKREGVGYVIELCLPDDYIQRQEQCSLAYSEHQEIKVPTSELTELNRNLLTPIRVVSTLGEVAKANKRNKVVPHSLAGNAVLKDINSFN